MKIEDYNKYYIQDSDHYLIPKDVFKELFNEMINWKEESQRQKEAKDKFMKNGVFSLEYDKETLKDMVLKLEEENKKFIKYLEDYQDGASRSLDSYDCGINDCLGDVLSKYKEIIGDNK